MSEKVDSPAQRGFKFEREVASIYRALGAEVVHDVAIAGNQIDVLAHERTTAGTLIRTAIECKAYSSQVGIEVVRSFAALANLLKSRGLIERAAIVSLNGYTRNSREAAAEFGVDLIEIDDLRKKIEKQPELLIKAKEEISVQDHISDVEIKPKRLFVVMPFAPEFNDIYILGIREVAENLGFVVERADEIEHIEPIVDVIQEKIRSCDAIIADTTGRNPNVFYEVGYANGVNCPAVLICREGDDIPFDLAGVNFIKYGSIVNLRERLDKRLRAIFDVDQP
ncbi:hypothetical protein DSCW_34660 [Desulfosarcina widdelii]|uniref:Restriction endonuclease type IV Mrr domain-containing protein n=1 Tax=Desulfosarcina widdelii TaxID=947919 RepID=A0A5K7Z7B9_9BACT|nr:restriction endonuclease [Desulfosarcina widdelii]BBO76049.1 hypothetical protein DSCW_34660 [Desulfosarcina widdelii]